MPYCTMCGSPIPENQGSKTCSMCYGDPGHGKDGYYQKFLEEQYEQYLQEQYEQEEYQRSLEKEENN